MGQGEGDGNGDELSWGWRSVWGCVGGISRGRWSTIQTPHHMLFVNRSLHPPAALRSTPESVTRFCPYHDCFSVLKLLLPAALRKRVDVVVVELSSGAS